MPGRAMICVKKRAECSCVGKPSASSTSSWVARRERGSPNPNRQSKGAELDEVMWEELKVVGSRGLAGLSSVTAKQEPGPTASMRRNYPLPKLDTLLKKIRCQK